MPHSFGLRSRTRSTFARPFRAHGPEHMSTYLRTFRVGDYVDIKANGAIHKGMPQKGYHGRTGRVWNVTPRAVGVEVNKQVRGRILKKRIHVRVEHVHASNCRSEFLKRRAANDRIKRLPKEERPKVSLKRLPAQPQPGKFVKVGKEGVNTITPVRYVLLV